MDKREAKVLAGLYDTWGKQQEQLTTRLRELLDFLTKDKGKKANVGLALQKLEFAASDYILSKRYFVDPYDGKEVSVTLSEERARLTRIRDSLVKALDEAQSNPFNPFCNQISKDLERLVRGASRALQNENDIPNKVEDEDREYLAWQVALVFRDVLGIKAARTRDDPTKNQISYLSYKAAAYAKVLRLTFGLARISGWETKDLGRDIAKGLQLLNDDGTNYKIRTKEANEIDPVA